MLTKSTKAKSGKGNQPYPSIDQKLCFALYSSALAMLQSYKPMLAEIGLTYPQYLVMLVLWEGDSLSVKYLAERVGQDPGSVTPLVKRLEEAGFLTRKRDTNDERNLSIELTAAGRALQKAAEEASGRFVLACNLSQADGGALRDKLHGLTRSLRDAS